MNRDNTVDIVVPNYNAGTVTVVLNHITQNATATLSNVALACAGPNSVSAAYPGDGNYSSSASNALQLAVSGIVPTMTLAGVPSATVAYGVVLGVSVTVASPLSCGATPSGTVKYSIDGGALQTATLASGAVTIQLSQLAVGNHSIAVSYGGDLYFAALAAQTLALKVNAATPATWGLFGPTG